MKLHRYNSVYPEWAYFESDDEALVALGRVRRQPAGWRGCATFVLICGTVTVVCMLAGIALLRLFADLIWSRLLHLSMPSLLYIFLPVVVAAVAGPLVAHYATRHRERIALRRVLQEKGIPICVGCGYDCRGLAEPRCPECGREFDPKLLRPAAPSERLKADS